MYGPTTGTDLGIRSKPKTGNRFGTQVKAYSMLISSRPIFFEKKGGYVVSGTKSVPAGENLLRPQDRTVRTSPVPQGTSSPSNPCNLYPTPSYSNKYKGTPKINKFWSLTRKPALLPCVPPAPFCFSSQTHSGRVTPVDRFAGQIEGFLGPETWTAGAETWGQNALRGTLNSRGD